MRRIVSILAMAALMAALVTVSVFPAFAAGESLTRTFEKGPHTCTVTFVDNDGSGTLTRGDTVSSVSCARST